MFRYTVVDNTEFTFPDYDFSKYRTATKTVDLHCMRGGGTGAQILLRDVTGDDIGANISVSGIKNYELYELVPIVVEFNAFLDAYNCSPNFPVRWAPFSVYDCLKPFDGKLDVKNGTAGIYLYVFADEKDSPDIIKGKISINGTNVPIKLTVYDVAYKGTDLSLNTGYDERIIAQYHRAEFGSTEYDELENKYLKMYRRAHQTTMNMNNRSCNVKKIGNNKYDFDFSEIERLVNKCLSLGFKTFIGPWISEPESWWGSSLTVNGIPCMSREGYIYIKQYLIAWVEFLKKNNWIDIFYTEPLNQPSDKNAIEYRALCGMIHKIAPELKIVTTSVYSNFYGTADLIVPMNSSYHENTEDYELLRNDAEMWFYICSNPRCGGYINRYTDAPLLATRYLHYSNYKYNLTGYRHWGGNCFQPNQDPEQWENNPYAPWQNPFAQSCPLHRVSDLITFLPPGDANFVYPGLGEPYMSMRLEAQRESVEDYELLRHIENTNKFLADEFCNKVFKSFKNVDLNPVTFKANRIEMLKTASKMNLTKK